MKQTYFNQVSKATLTQLTSLVDSIEKEKSVSQRNMIEHYSPFSNEINQSITDYEELFFYCSLELSEATVTRRSLIRKIDPDLFVTSEGKTNMELMKGGHSPYAYDAEDGIVELHHIGQNKEGPFAELTHSEHMMHGNNQKLHRALGDSWRNEEKSEAVFGKERSNHWRKRAEGKVKILYSSSHLPIAYSSDLALINSKEVLNVFARLLAECSYDDLMFVSDSAKMYACFRKLGAKTVIDFAKQSLGLEQICCSNCNSTNFVSNGTYISNSERRQRYVCNECGHSFTLMRRSIISESNLSFATWITFIVCLYQGLPIAETASICGISERSVQNNRLRLFYALKILDERVRLWGKVALDEKCFPVSFKGNHSENKNVSANRKPHKRGSENRTRGLSKEQVSVICALDEYGNSVARVTGVGGASAYRIQCALNNSIDKDNVVCLFSDKSSALRRYANDNGIKIKQTKSKKDRRKARTPASMEKAHWLQKINSYHSKLSKFMSKFSGTSSDMLYGYLCLFTWKCRNKDRDPIDAYRELFSVMIEPNLYKSLDEIALLPCFSGVTAPKRKEKDIKILKRNMAIFAKYAAGVPVTKIAKRYKLSCSRIHEIIKLVRKLGYGYTTEKEKRREERLARLEAPRPPHINKTKERNRRIYEERMAWTGSAKDFYKEVTQKYGLSKQRIMNIISEEKRVISLSDNLTVLDTFTYRELEDIYRDVYRDYIEGVMNGKPKMALTVALADKYGYGVPNIRRILSIMKSDSFNGEKQHKKKARSDVINRDKELFVALLNWTGTQGEFAAWAQKKYGLTSDYVKHIVTLHYKANPKRYDMIHP